MIELTFKGNSLTEVFESMKAALGGEKIAEVEQAVVDSVQQETAKSRKVEEAKAVSLAEIQTLTKAKLEEKKSKAIKALLAEFGTAKVSGVAEEDYAAFYEKLEVL
ncbi:hypothetical protein [Streptococcus ovis]|uniref:hypothetical protein n=1 Tax=Streptococcus ovis TaxID=82806 RepID=UPI0003821A6E|nr:hypothetical protein [Streptococcus ovis]